MLQHIVCDFEVTIRYVTGAVERVARYLALMDEVARTAKLDRAELDVLVRNHLMKTRSMDGFIRTFGVVKERVICHLAVDDHMQLNKLNQDCWTIVRRYLVTNDIKPDVAQLDSARDVTDLVRDFAIRLLSPQVREYSGASSSLGPVLQGSAPNRARSLLHPVQIQRGIPLPLRATDISIEKLSLLMFKATEESVALVSRIIKEERAMRSLSIVTSDDEPFELLSIYDSWVTPLIENDT
ncbi:hypothetical protein MRX96_012859 [Rhipicephalus microplus]